MNDIQDIFPIVKISDNKILSGIGDITFGYEVVLPELFGLTHQDYESMYSGLLSAFSIFREGITVTQQDHYTGHEITHSELPDYKNYALKQNCEKYAGRLILNHKSYLYVSFPDKHINALTSSQNSATKKTNFLKNPFTKFPSTFDNTVKLNKELSIALQGIDNLKFNELSDAELKKNIFYHYSFDDEYKNGKMLPEIQKSDGYLRVGNKYVGIISMVNHGDIVQLCKHHKGTPYIDDRFSIERGIGLELGIMYQTGFGLPFEHTVSRTFTLKDRESTDLKFFFENSKENFLAAFGIENAGKRLEAIEGFKDAVGNRNYNYADMSCTIMIPCDTLDELKEKCTAAKTVLRKINEAQVYEEPYSEALPIFVGNTPGYTRGNYRTFTTVMQHALTYFSFETVRKGFTQGHLFINRLGEPTYLETWKSENIDNRNGLVEGGSGSGKSFLLNNIIDQDLENNYHVIILDVGHTYRDLCTINGGIYFDSAKLEDLAFNIFDCSKDEKGNYCPDDSKILFLQSVLISIWKGTGEEATNSEIAVVIDLVVKYYSKVNESKSIPTMTDFYAFLTNYELPTHQSFFPLKKFLSTRVSAHIGVKNGQPFHIPLIIST